MGNIWTVLGVEVTKDISAIKRAYAQKARTFHPEEDLQGFLELRKAYQEALSYAEGETGCFTELDPMESEAINADGKMPGAEKPEEPGDDGWTLSGKPRQVAGANPYADHEAIRSFLDLYTGKQRKDSKRWLDYFTSDAFLNAAWDWRFTAMLLEHIVRLEEEYKVNREFLNWLCVAYQLTVSRAVYSNPDGSERTEFEFQIHTGARFEGQESVFEIATKGPAPKQFKGNELAIYDSFTEYHRLVSMADKGVWSESEIGEYSQIIYCYAASYITDKCQQRWDVDHERHPAGLRLITHFFRRDGLPEELYRILWQRLDLKDVIMGRAKILYGSLKELVLERLPELADQQREKYTQLREDFNTYAINTYKQSGKSAQATDEDIQKTDIFFAREDFQRALLDRRFVEDEMLHTWVHESRCDYYLKRIIQFYNKHENAPCAQRVMERAREMLRCQELARRLQKDKETKASDSAVNFKSSAFFRHWLNTGFYQASDPESGCRLLEYLSQELPFLPEWSREFLKVTGEDIVPVPVNCVLGSDTVEIRFHLRYMEFLLNGNPIYRPCLKWERVRALADVDAFFFCLPVTVTTYGKYEVVKAEILRRLEDTAAPQDGSAVIAACLAGQVCSLPLPGEVGQVWNREEYADREVAPEIRSLPPESVLPFELFAEDTEHLYGCTWNEGDQALMLFEQLPFGRQMLRDGLFDGVEDARSAIALARQVLEETLNPPRLPMEQLVNLPDAVYAKLDFNTVCRDQNASPLWSSPAELLGEAVTTENLEELLTWFAAGWIERLELSWKDMIPIGKEQDYDPQRALVFMKAGSSGYVCLYFDDLRAKSYALLEKPELYGKVKDNISFVPFRRGRLFRQVIHRSFSSIRRRLDVIFRQVSWPNNVKFMAGGIWDYAINVSHGRTKYYLDKQLLADFPVERAHNGPDAPFYFSFYPDSAACVDDEGGVETLEDKPSNRGQLQQMLIRFLKGGFHKLRLTWGKEKGRRRHIVLLQDSGRFLMAWVQEEKQTVEYHVADVRTYMDVAGKKYPKDTFQGRITPAYLIHDGVMPLRNALDLLLTHIENPVCITDKIAEYAGEKPVKPRPYGTLWAELVGDTLR